MMPPRSVRAWTERSDEVLAYAAQHLPAEQFRLFERFFRAYYARVAAEDVRTRDVLDLYGAAMAHLQFGRVRHPGQALVHVYSPTFGEHGWASPHMVVEVVTDDMPFLLESTAMELTRHGLQVHVLLHPILAVRRDQDGTLLSAQPIDAPDASPTREAYLHLEVDRRTDPAILEGIRSDVLRVLGDVRVAVQDWPRMLDKARHLAKALDEQPPPVDPTEREEAQALLRWLCEDHFTFLGYREYEIISTDGDPGLHAIGGSGLGLLRERGSRRDSRSLASLPPEARTQALAPVLLNLTKANSRATVHRPGYLDYIGIKRFDDSGAVSGECRFIGLYTSAVYNQPPQAIPILRRKVRAVVSRADLPPASHNARALTEILATYPRDELFQMTEDELYESVMTILALHEQNRLRLLVRRDRFGRFLSCLVFFPRDRLTTAVRLRIQDILLRAFSGVHLEYQTHVSESRFARLHLIIHTRSGTALEYDHADLEARLARTLRSWTDDLYDSLVGQYGEERGGWAHQRYVDAFPSAYREEFSARTAVSDLGRIEALSADDDLGMYLYHPVEASAGSLRLKLYRPGRPINLSDVMPMLEQMGVRVLDERPYEIKARDADPVWTYEFDLRCAEYAELDGAGRERFEEALLQVWRGDAENDGFNRLVLTAGLRSREVAVLRTYAKYLRQIGTRYSQNYMQDSLANNPELARLLVELFTARLDPDLDGDRELETKRLVTVVKARLDAVDSLDEDRIIRSLLWLVQATLRTNYFQTDAQGRPKQWMSIKLDPRSVPDLPAPRPMFEIFIYSPRTEGVHLRGGRVARGGLRWSDRREDYRTEILGLMKAQMVKNAVIVPAGAKGGFVVKRPPDPANRQATQAEVLACYQTFIRGLLDITDNRVGSEVVPPPRVVRHDSDDPYLVVAADKGTATFSDAANAISAEYGYWLGDAFASGGSSGYDHKAMGITARGAWVSVRRHFYELGVDVDNDDVTAIGIGDMSGDVFGNGMLMSRHLKLVAAFDHRHIFLDPDPDPQTSYAERARLFALPRSSWADYDPALISEGGGVYPRTAKAVRLSLAMRDALDCSEPALTPDETVRTILRAPVGLFWNGGIGTYVKASHESHADVGDKSNDSVRVDASELRCRVVGEGGNLGFTQLGRIEFALNGGRINTDAIDNSAGVDCSDHEVNIKILLDQIVADGDMTVRQRNALLGEMTDEVAQLVLADNEGQTRVLSVAATQATPMASVHARHLRSLDQSGRLDRALEFLPSTETIDQRAAAGGGLTAPEFAVLLAYAKITLNDALLDSDIPEDPHLARALEEYFPQPLRDRFAERMAQHPLHREIVATTICNQLVNRAGTTFAYRLGEETGASLPDIARAYIVAWEIFGLSAIWDDIVALDTHLASPTQISMFLEVRKLAERAARWLLRTRRQPLDVSATIGYFAPSVTHLIDRLPRLLSDRDGAQSQARMAELVTAGMPEQLAHRVVGLQAELSALDITDVSQATGRDLEEVAGVYFILGEQLRLDAIHDRAVTLPRGDRWSALARAALRDELHRVRAGLTTEVLRESSAGAPTSDQYGTWLANNRAAASRYLGLFDDIAASAKFDLATLSVALQEIRALVHTSGATGQ
jgi:glutamate dehydrogenase